MVAVGPIVGNGGLSRAASGVAAGKAEDAPCKNANSTLNSLVPTISFGAAIHQIRHSAHAPHSARGPKPGSSISAISATHSATPSANVAVEYKSNMTLQVESKGGAIADDEDDDDDDDDDAVNRLDRSLTTLEMVDIESSMLMKL